MTDAPAQGPDYSDTLYLPKTDFPMRAGLPQKEPEILARWQRDGLYGQLRRAAAGRPKFVLHDGPPYANGNIHIGHALNKILKDLVVRSEQMAGKDSNYVPGWDCHGLPIEWKVEEENYRRKGKTKPDFSDAKAMVAFRRECRATAEHWVSVQREEFKRLGVVGDWDHPYLTMTYPAEAQIAREIHKFAANGLLYRGSKPVMWSVVEKTALAEAEVEYEDHVSDTIYVAFPIAATVPRRSLSLQSPGRRWNRLAVSPERAAVRHLDDDAMDDPRQPRDRLFRAHSHTGSTASSDAPKDNWAKPGARLRPRQATWRTRFSHAARVDRLRAGRRRSAARCLCTACVCAHPLQLRCGYDVPRAAARRRARHRRRRHGLRPHRAEPRPRGLRTVDGDRASCSTERGIDTRIPYIRSTRTAPSPTRRPASPASACSPTRASKATPTRR